MTLAVFAYGSLIGQPELAERLLERVPARLTGWHRSFNKRSRNRGTPIDEAWDVPPHPLYEKTGWRHSLALGTEDGGVIEGAVLRYPAECEDELIARLDAREGYNPAWPQHANGYLRSTVEVEVAGRPEQVLAYLSNPAHDCVWRLPPTVDLATRAAILIAASPRDPGPDEWRGLHYLQQVRLSLAGHGIVDERLEALADAVRAVPGPWGAALT